MTAGNGSALGRARRAGFRRALRAAGLDASLEALTEDPSDAALGGRLLRELLEKAPAKRRIDLGLELVVRESA
ncbi:MAG: hypothetical protein KGQ57_09610 [Burkholderiales bacterium]|nr:hypothetical protein [Burkholderiales bacterium]